MCVWAEEGASGRIEDWEDWEASFEREEGRWFIEAGVLVCESSTQMRLMFETIAGKGTYRVKMSCRLECFLNSWIFE